MLREVLLQKDLLQSWLSQVYPYRLLGLAKCRAIRLTSIVTWVTSFVVLAHYFNLFDLEVIDREYNLIEITINEY
uniref:Uncharacterized protein n=1 Tax=Glossina palpalis gambiensis TaxID=67801 RepID=A0A1B0BHI5_9MUSC